MSIKEKISNVTHIEKTIPKLSVKISSKEHALLAIENGVDAIYLSGEVFLPRQDFTSEDIVEILNNKKDCKVILGMPRMCSSSDFNSIEQKIKNIHNATEKKLDGIQVTSLGAISRFSKLGIPFVGDASLNIYNHNALDFYGNQGIELGTLSIELPLNDMIETVVNSKTSTELVVAGAPTVMYLEHDLYKNLDTYDRANLSLENNRYEDNETLVLVNDLGVEVPVYKSKNKRNHILTSKEFCYLPLLKELSSLGINWFRIEGCHYTKEELTYITELYRKAVDALSGSNAEKVMLDLYKNMETIRAGSTLGALDFD